MLISGVDVEVPMGSLESDAVWLDDFPDELQVGTATLPNLPLEILELAVDIAACGPPGEPGWLEECQRLGSDLSSSQLADISIWASGLMPDFGLPSEVHAGLFSHRASQALRTRLGAPDPMPWSYEIASWAGEEGRHICIVAVQRKLLEAKARVSEVFVRPVLVFGSSEARAAARKNDALVENLLGATILYRRSVCEE